MLARLCLRSGDCSPESSHTPHRCVCHGDRLERPRRCPAGLALSESWVPHAPRWARSRRRLPEPWSCSVCRLGVAPVCEGWGHLASGSRAPARTADCRGHRCVPGEDVRYGCAGAAIHGTRVVECDIVGRGAAPPRGHKDESIPTDEVSREPRVYNTIIIWSQKTQMPRHSCPPE